MRLKQQNGMTMLKSKKGQQDIGGRLTDNLINIVVVAILAVSLIPIAVTAIINISLITDNPVPALFAAGGVVIVLIFIGLFRGILPLTGLKK